MTQSKRNHKKLKVKNTLNCIKDSHNSRKKVKRQGLSRIEASIPLGQ